MPETFMRPSEETPEEATINEVSKLEPSQKQEPTSDRFIRMEDDWNFEDETYSLMDDEHLDAQDHLRIDESASKLYQATAEETDVKKKKANRDHLKRYEAWRKGRKERPYEFIHRVNTSKRVAKFEKSKLDRYVSIFSKGVPRAHEGMTKKQRESWTTTFSKMHQPDDIKRKTLLTGLISDWTGIPSNKVAQHFPEYLQAFRESELGIQGEANEATVFGEVNRWLQDKMKERDTRHAIQLDVSDAVDDAIFEGGTRAELTKRIREGVKGTYGDLIKPEHSKAAMNVYAKRAKFYAPHLKTARKMFDLLDARVKGKGDAVDGELRDLVKEAAYMSKDDRAALIYTIYKMADRESGEAEGGNIEKTRKKTNRALGDWTAALIDIFGGLAKKTKAELENRGAHGVAFTQEHTRGASTDGRGTVSHKGQIKSEHDLIDNAKEFAQDLRGVKEIVARIDSENWFMQSIYDAAGSLPYTVAAAIPYVGLAANAAVMTNSADIDLRRAHPELSRGDRRGVSLATGVLQSAVERLSFRGAVRKMPKLDSALAKIGVVGTGIMRAGRSVALEYTEEAIQEATPAVLQNLARAANEDMPEVTADEWANAFRIFFGDSRTFGAVLPLAIVMGGGTTAIDRMGAGKAREMLGSFDRAWLAGADQAEAKAISSEKDVFKAQNMLRNAMEGKTEEEIKTNREAALKDGALDRVVESEVEKNGTDIEKAALKAEVARRDYVKQHGATITENEDGTATVEYGERTNLPNDTFESVEDAVLAADAHNADTYEGFLNELRTSAKNIEAMREQAKSLKKSHEGAKVKLGQDIQTPAEYAAESAENMQRMIERVQIDLNQRGIERQATVEDLNRYATLGNVVLREKARGYIARISKDGNIATVLEEGAEGWLRDSIKYDAVTADEIKQELIDYQSFSGDKFTKATTAAEMSDQEMIEGFSRLAQAHAFNKAQLDEMPGRLSQLIRSLTEFFRAVLKAAEGLMKLKESGQLSENLETWLDKSVGLDSDQQVERMKQEAQQEILEETKRNAIPQPTPSDYRARGKFVGEHYAGKPNSIAIQVRDLGANPMGDGIPVYIDFDGNLENTDKAILSHMRRLNDTHPDHSRRETSIKILGNDGMALAQVRYNPEKQTVQYASQEDIEAVRKEYNRMHEDPNFSVEKKPYKDRDGDEQGEPLTETEIREGIEDEPGTLADVEIDDDKFSTDEAGDSTFSIASNVPIVKRSSMKGKKKFVYFSDWTRVGVYTGLHKDSGIGIDLQGGALYPYLDGHKGNAGWAFTTDGMFTRFQGRVDSTDGIGLTTLYGKDNLRANPTFLLAYVEELKYAVKVGLVTEEQMLESINTARTQVLGLSSKRKNKDTGEVKVKYTVSRESESFQAFSNEWTSIDGFQQAMEAATFEIRGAMFSTSPKVITRNKVKTKVKGEFSGGRLASQKNVKAGMPDIIQMIDLFADPMFDGAEYGTIVGAIQFEKGQKKPSTAEEIGAENHLSYPVVIKGEGIGIFDSFIHANEVVANPKKKKGHQLTRSSETSMAGASFSITPAQDYTGQRIDELLTSMEEGETELDVVERMLDTVIPDAPNGYFPDDLVDQFENARAERDEDFDEWGGRGDSGRMVEDAVDALEAWRSNSKKSHSIAPKADPVIARVRDLMRDPDTRLEIYGKMADRLADVRREVDIHLVINGSSTVRPAVVEQRTMTELRKEAAKMRREATAKAENEVYDDMGGILSNEEITRLSDQPVTKHIITEGGLKSRTAAIKQHGDDMLIGGEYDDMGGIPPMYYGGSWTPDQMAGILFEEGLITENSVPAMLEAIDSEINSVASNKELLGKAKARLKSAREDAKKESDKWLAGELKLQERDHSPRSVMLRSMASYNAIVSVLPAEIRGRVGGIMKLAGFKTEEAAQKELIKRLEKADGLLEKHLQKQYREKVTKAVDQAMPKAGKSSSVKKGKMVYNYTDELKEIAKVLSMSPGQVADAVEDAASRHEKAQIGEELDEETFADSTEDLARLVMYGNIYNTSAPVSSEQMAEALSELEVLVRDGRTRWQARQEQEKARLSGVRIKTTDVVTGGKGRVPSADIIKNNTEKKKKDYLKREHLRNISFEFLLNAISRNDKSSETLGSYINKHFAPMVHQATHHEHIQLAKRRDNLLKAMSTIYGLDSETKGWKAKMEKILAQHAKINYKSGVARIEHSGTRTVDVKREDAQLAIDGITRYVHHGYSFVELSKKEIETLRVMLDEDASKDRGQPKQKFKLVQEQDGVLREQALSQDIGMFLSMMYAQEDLRPAMEAHGYDAVVMDEIEGFLADESKALRAWLFQEYKNIHPYVNKMFREHFGYSLPSKKNYAPAKFNHAGRDIKELIDEGHGAQSNTPGFAIERIRHKSAPRFDVGAIEAYMMHIEEAEHFVNWYEVVKELRSVFMNRDVRDHIKEQHGNEAHELILERIDTFAQGGTMERKNRFADHLRKTFTVAKLSYNWGVFLKQLTSLPAYTFDIPVSQYVKYQAEFFAKPVEAYKLISEKDYTKQRFTQGYDRDIMAVMNAMNGGKGKLQKAAEFGMMFGRVGDIIPVIVGGYANYRYNYEKAIKAGKTTKEADAVATLAFEMSTDRAQQSGNLKDQSHYSMGGSWSRVLTMFQTSPRQYYSNMSEAILDGVAGRKNGTKRAAKQAFIAHVVLPSLFYWTSVFTRNAFRDDDDKEDLNEMLNGWYLSMLMGPTSGIFLWGQIVNEVVSGYEYSVPIMEWGGEIGEGGMRLHKMYAKHADDDDTTNVTADDVIDFLDNMATAGSLAIGRGATWYDIGTSRAKSVGFTKDDAKYLAMSKEDQAIHDCSAAYNKLYKEKLPEGDDRDTAQQERFESLADEYRQLKAENQAEWPNIREKLIKKNKMPKAVQDMMD